AIATSPRISSGPSGCGAVSGPRTWRGRPAPRSVSRTPFCPCPPTGGGPRAVARALGASLGVAATVLPMTDDAVRTEVRTPDGWLEFQEYFVHRGQAPEVHEVRFRGIEGACITPEARAAIEAAHVV